MKVSRKASRRVGTEEGARWGKENSNYSEQALRIRVTGVVTSLVGQSDRFSFSGCPSPQPAHWTFCDPRGILTHYSIPRVTNSNAPGGQAGKEN